MEPKRDRGAARQKGAFVYQGAGKKQPKDAPPEQWLCIDESIAIQRCMARNNHRQDRCTEAVDVWKRCNARVKELTMSLSAWMLVLIMFQ